MKEFIALVSREQTSDVNPVLFDRTAEPSISDFIVSGLKVIESLPYIKFTNWEHTADASKIELKLNRRHIKNKAINKDKDITKLVNIRGTAQEMLTMEFIIDYEGESRYIKKNLLIPAYVDRYHMFINGKMVLPQKQLVDMSTYNQKKSVKLKTTLTPIDIYREPLKKPMVSTKDDEFMIKTFILNLFTKNINPLYYYAAKFGLLKTINYFSMKRIVEVVDTEYDTDIYYYFRATKDLLVEVDKRYFGESDFVRAFTHMVYDIVKSEKSKLEHMEDVEYWTTRLGSIFTTNTKNQLNKGRNVLVSFGRVLDNITKDTLRLNEKHLKSTHSVIRWMLQNFTDLRRKDNHDLTLKRIRCNEVTAFYFIHAMSTRINNLLNAKKITIESIERIFNWNSDELFKIMVSSSNSILKYDPEINCFDLLNGLRYTNLGRQGITGGKNIGNQFRDIYSTHLGRIDLNGISHGKNTALTGFLVPRCKIYNNGFFSEETKDPDNYNSYMKQINKMYDDNKITVQKDLYAVEKIKKLDLAYAKVKPVELERRDGYLVIHKFPNILRNEDTNTVVIQATSKKALGYRRTYRNKDGGTMTEDGFHLIRPASPIPKVDGVYKISKALPTPDNGTKESTDVG